MAHRNRWFTVLKNGDFPWRTVTNNQMVTITNRDVVILPEASGLVHQFTVIVVGGMLWNLWVDTREKIKLNPSVLHGSFYISDLSTPGMSKCPEIPSTQLRLKEIVTPCNVKEICDSWVCLKVSYLNCSMANHHVSHQHGNSWYPPCSLRPSWSNSQTYWFTSSSKGM